MDCIAEQRFFCRPSRGEPFVLMARIGRPYTEERAEPQSHSNGACPTCFEPLVEARTFRGHNQFQALCLAIEHLRIALKVFTREGGRVYWEDTDSLVDFDNAWFGPFPGRDVFKGAWWKAENAAG